MPFPASVFPSPPLLHLTSSLRWSRNNSLLTSGSNTVRQSSADSEDLNCTYPLQPGYPSDAIAHVTLLGASLDTMLQWIARAGTCILIVAFACALYWGIFLVAAIVMFLGPFGLPIYWLCICAMTLLPALALLFIVRVIVKQAWVAVVVTLIAIPVSFTLCGLFTGSRYHIDQVSVRPEHYDALITTKKERLLLVLYCYPPRNLTDNHFMCWRLISTSFDVYLLRADHIPEVAKVATISFGTSITDRNYGGLSWRGDYSLDIQGWSDDGKVYLREAGRHITVGKNYAVDAASATVAEVTSLPAQLDLKQNPRDPPLCLTKWGGTASTPLHHDHLAISGLEGGRSVTPEGKGYHLRFYKPGQSLDLLTDHDNTVKTSFFLLDARGEVVSNPEFGTAMPTRLYCDIGWAHTVK
jgi:hypothetical protein